MKLEARKEELEGIWDDTENVEWMSSTQQWLKIGAADFEGFHYPSFASIKHPMLARNDISNLILS